MEAELALEHEFRLAIEGDAEETWESGRRVWLNLGDGLLRPKEKKGARLGRRIMYSATPKNRTSRCRSTGDCSLHRRQEHGETISYGTAPGDTECLRIQVNTAGPATY